MNEIKIGDFLHRIRRPIELFPNTDYNLVTIKMHHKGVVLRGQKKGSEIKSKMYQVKEGDFILSGIDARNGAFGIVSKELDNAIVTNDFWYFELDENIINKYFFLELTSTSWFDNICRLGSDGTTQRIRLQKDKFFNQKITLPSLLEQETFLKKVGLIKHLKEELNKQQNFIQKIHKTLLEDVLGAKF